MNKNQLYLFLLFTFCITACHTDDIKNTYTISGKIAYAGDILFSPCTVDLISNDQIIATSSNAIFSFSGLEEGKSYSIMPHGDPSRNGVSTLDKVQIEKYIGGQIQLTPFQKLAADVNKDNVIDTTDIDLIVNCIIGNQCFGWRFASADYNDSGVGYADPYIVSNLMSNEEINFIPIKLGDVNGTVGPH